MKYKAVLFDLDGTLLDSVPTILRSAKETFAVMGLPYDEAAVKKTIGIPLEVQATAFAGPRAVEFVDRYKTIYRTHFGEDSRFFPGTVEMLDAVRAGGYLTAVVTSKSSRSAQRTLARDGMAGRFEAIVTCDDVVRPKPDAEPVLKALDLLRLTPPEAIFVGDSMFDVDCAQRAGVAMVAVSWGVRSREDLLLQCPNGVFDSWQELLEWLGLPAG
jgi:pyrophosphatase PpaX